MPLYRTSYRSLRAAAAGLVLSAMIAGCGGSGDDGDSGSGSTGGRVTSGIAIAWGERTRAVEAGSAPLSARISFTRPTASSADVTYTVDRNEAPSAYTQSYLTTTPIPIGATTLRVDFYSGRKGGGSLVATATTGAVVRSDGTVTDLTGTSLGTVTAQSKIATVTVQPLTLNVGATTALVALARDAAGNLLALEPGAYAFSIVDGADTSVATIATAGTITGDRAGTTRVRASVDGVTSADATVTVQFGIGSGIVVIEGASNDLVYSSARGRLFVATTADAAQPNSVVSYDPSSGALDAVYRIGGTLGPFATSPDGSVLYVGLRNGNAIRRIDTATGAVGAPISLGADRFFGPLYAESLAVSPANPNVVTVGESRENTSPRFNGLAVFANGTQTATSSGQSTQANSIAYNADGTELYTLNNETTGFDLQAFTATPNSLTLARTVRGAVESFGETIRFAAGKIYISEGSVYDPATLTPVGRFEIGEPRQAFAIDAARGRAYFASSNDSGQVVVRVFDTATYAILGTRTFPALDGIPVRAEVIGANRIAVGVENRIYLIDLSI